MALKVLWPFIVLGIAFFFWPLAKQDGKAAAV